MRPIDLVFALSLPPAALLAQTATPNPGDRVRIHFTEARSSQVVTGKLLFQDADSVTLLEEVKAGSGEAPGRGGQLSTRLTEGRRVSVRRPVISRVEMSTGRHSLAGTGALIGAGVGVLGGATLGIAALCSNNDGFLCLETASQIVGVVAAGTAVGAGLGAIVGACIHHEKWVSASQGPRASVMVLPVEQGTALGLSIRF